MLYLIHGEDDFLSHEILTRNKNNFIKKHGENNISIYNEENFDWGKFLADIQSLPFLGEKRLIILENIISKFNKEEKQKIIELIPQIPESTVIIFWENQKVKDNNFLKTIPSKNIFYSPQLWGYEINNWIVKKLAEKKYKIEKQALSLLSSLVGNDTRQLSQELGKLMALKHKEKIITEEDVKSLVKAQLNTNIFTLTDALARKDLKTAQKIIKNITDSGETLHSVLGMITFQFRNIILLKIAEEEKIPKEEVIKKTGIHPFVFQKTSSQIKNFTLEQLKEIYRLILQTDIDIKTGKKEEKLALDLLVIKICM